MSILLHVQCVHDVYTFLLGVCLHPGDLLSHQVCAHLSTGLLPNSPQGGHTCQRGHQWDLRTPVTPCRADRVMTRHFGQ